MSSFLTHDLEPAQFSAIIDDLGHSFVRTFIQ